MVGVMRTNPGIEPGPPALPPDDASLCRRLTAHALTAREPVIPAEHRSLGLNTSSGTSGSPAAEEIAMKTSVREGARPRPVELGGDAGPSSCRWVAPRSHYDPDTHARAIAVSPEGVRVCVRGHASEFTATVADDVATGTQLWACDFGETWRSRGMDPGST